MGLLRTLARRWRTARKIRHLRKEARHYRTVFAARALTVPSEAEIQERIVRRLPVLRAKPKGELRLLAIYHSYNWEETSLAPSLARFGSLRYIDWLDPSLAAGSQPGDPAWRERMNEGLLRRVAQWHAERPFDAVFTYLAGAQISAKTVSALQALGAPIVNLALNDKETFVGKLHRGNAPGMRDICRHFDLCWTSTYDALEKYVVEGATPIYLPEGANPDVHRPYQEERCYDVSFVGQCYGNRPEIVSRLRKAGIRVETFGPGWPAGALTTEEMVRTWSRSRINLGFSGVLGHGDTYCLKGRDFEVPMAGGLYLTEHHDELGAFYDIGREIVTWRDYDDLLAKIQVLLARPDETESIRLAGHARAVREHSWEMRFDRVLRVMGVLR